MSSGKAEYISAAVVCMSASHLRMLTLYDLRFMGCDQYDQDVVKLEPARIIIDNEAAICMNLNGLEQNTN